MGLSSDQDHRLESREARRASAGVVALDPFGETSNPDEYVPREASEEGLLALGRAVRSGRTAALSAPPGFGKTLFLRLLAKRLAPGFRCLFLPDRKSTRLNSSHALISYAVFCLKKKK